MPSPAYNSKNPSSKNLETEEILHGVVLTDNFDERLHPLTLEKPSCLLPLGNAPLLEYTLEFLAVAGINDIIIICGQFSRLITEYIENSKWKKSITGPKVQVIVADCKNPGDALRELDAKQLIKSDFVLVSGDIVTNIYLDRALEMHRLRRHADSSVLMTMVVKRLSEAHRTRSIGQKTTFILDAQNHECLYFESQSEFSLASSAHFSKPPKRLELDAGELFKGRSEIQLRADLVDCQIDICSPEVLALFTENFDYGDLRSDFLKSILDSDLLERKIYCHIVSSEYAARVNTPHMYDSVMLDVFGRWAFPFLPDSNLSEGSHYKFQRGNLIKEPSVVLSRSAFIGNNVIIGSGTTIGGGALVQNCTIGRNCKIENGVRITNSYIWDNVVVKSNSIIHGAILADGAIVESNCKVDSGCVLSFKVQIGPNITLKPFTRLTTLKLPSDELRRSSSSFPLPSSNAGGDKALGTTKQQNRRLSKASVEVSSGLSGANSSCSSLSSEISDAEAGAPPALERPVADKALVGERGFGFLWVCSGAETDAINASSIGYCAAANADDESDSFDSDEELEAKCGSDDDEELLAREISATIYRAIEQGHSADNAVLELNTLKMAFNATFTDIRRSVYPALVETINPAEGKTGVKKMMDRWIELFKRYTFNEDDQLETLRTFEQAVLSRQPLEVWSPLMIHILYYLYELDVVEEDAIFNWYDNGCGLVAAGKQGELSAEPTVASLQQQMSLMSFKTNPGTLTESENLIREKVKSFVTWLNEAESESEDDDKDAESSDSSSNDESYSDSD